MDEESMNRRRCRCPRRRFIGCLQTHAQSSVWFKYFIYCEVYRELKVISIEKRKLVEMYVHLLFKLLSYYFITLFANCFH